MKFKKNIGMAVILILSHTLLSCENIRDEQPTLALTVVSNPNFTLLEAAALKTGLALALSNTNVNDVEGNQTIFAPTNEAFAKLQLTDEASLSALNTDFLRKTLLYHINDGLISGDDLASATAFTPEKKLIRRGEELYINGSKILFTDAPAIKGAFHGIDRILLSTQINLLESVVAFSQGEIYSIPDLGFLLEAIEYAGLEDMLIANGELTIFAPTDQAFKLLGLEQAEDIQMLSKNEVRDILLNHIVQDGGKFTSEQDKLSQTTAGGGKIEYTPLEDGYFSIHSNGQAKSAQMLIPDIKTSNGVVHVVDQVLIP